MFDPDWNPVNDGVAMEENDEVNQQFRTAKASLSDTLRSFRKTREPLVRPATSRSNWTFEIGMLAWPSPGWFCRTESVLATLCPSSPLDFCILTTQKNWPCAGAWKLCRVSGNIRQLWAERCRWTE
ncbi:hypothetical protein pipiens_011181 [Culex pipiens pipiens]|uniref:Uncharacterized protein n=1 Tax=Culex pipiens pipiens TaxID=38569 RepID=A0ABD1DAJ5_CULPP